MGPLCGASSLLTSSPFSTFLTFCFTLENSLRLPALPWKFHFSLLSGAESLFLCPPSWPPVPASEPPGPLSWGHWPRPAPISGLHGVSEDGTGSLEEQASRKPGLGARRPHQRPGGEGPCWKAPGRQRTRAGRLSAGGSCGFSALPAAGRAPWHVSCSLRCPSPQPRLFSSRGRCDPLVREPAAQPHITSRRTRPPSCFDFLIPTPPPPHPPPLPPPVPETHCSKW